MALETREEFIEEWRKVAKQLLGPDAEEDNVVQAGDILYDARVLAYQVAEDGFNLTAHRYFHGMAVVPLNFMLQMPMPPEMPREVLPFLAGEYMFHQGFVAGAAYEKQFGDTGTKGVRDITGLGDADEAVECLGDRDNILRTREELEQRLMPAPVEALLQVQKMLAEMADQMPKPDEGDVPEGFRAALDEDEEKPRGYF